LPLMAHEAAHVVQQQNAPALQAWGSGGSDSFEREAHRASAAVVQGQPFAIRERTGGERVQRLGISDALDYFADKANIIPGFRMFTIIIGVNPINMSSVDRSAANILRAMVEFIPGGSLITQALDNYGIFEKVGAWIEQQIHSLGLAASSIRQAVMDFLDSLGWRDIFHLGDVWDRAKRIFTGPIDRIISFASGLITGILGFVREAVLRPLAKLAEGTPGYDLLKAVLGQDPVTGDPVPQTADALIGGFMKLIGQEEIWVNIKKANAVARAFAWFKGALSGLMGFVRQIPALFIQTLKSLEIMDFVVITRAFSKVGRAFGGFIGQFLSWAGAQVLQLLEIIFEVLAPAAVPYIKKAAGAFRTIIRNPVGFIGNLVRAGIQGFRQFGSNFLTHLKNSLINWLTGTLGGAGIYIPQAFSLIEIIKFVLSVLGLTWANIRQKLVTAIGETAVKVLETGFELVVTLVTQGPSAAWEKIKEGVSNLKEMVIDGVMSFVKDRIVQAAITKLVSMLNPAGAFIQAIIAIYNTIMFFIERLRQISQVAMSFIDSIAAIASGAIGAAADRVEQTMGGLLTLVISFLARLVGLGKVSDAVLEIINKVRAPISSALDKVIPWIVTMAKKAGKFIVAKIKGTDERTPEDKMRDLQKAVQEIRPQIRAMFAKGPPGRLFKIRLAVWKIQYRLTELTIDASGTVTATINPSLPVDQLVLLDQLRALAAIREEIVAYQSSGQSAQASAATVLATGSGQRTQPFQPGAVGNVTQGVQSVLATGGARGEASWNVITHQGAPVTAITQRTQRAGPTQGEVFLGPAEGVRGKFGAFPRTAQIPGTTPNLPSGPTAATVLTDPFAQRETSTGGRDSLAAGHIQEALVTGAASPTLDPAQARAVAAGALLLGPVEGIRNPLAMVTNPAVLDQSIRSSSPFPARPTGLATTLGGPQAPRGSRQDWVTLEHTLSRIDPATGQLQPQGGPGVTPVPRGVRDPQRPGSLPRAQALAQGTVDALANTILQGMMDDNRILVLNVGDLSLIRQRAREYLVANHGVRR
ncbi:MAG: hypothetical protein M3N54_10345, partial [Acidobacteriota bacterium]|nr:hypothetical protein [Acidobacteriota bacterium]